MLFKQINTEKVNQDEQISVQGNINNNFDEQDVSMPLNSNPTMSTDLTTNSAKISDARFCEQLINDIPSDLSEAELYKKLANIKMRFNQKSEELDYDYIMTEEDACLSTLIALEIKQANSVEENDERIVDFIKKENLTPEEMARMDKANFLGREMMKDENRVASNKSDISSTVPSAILCMDENGYLTEPSPGENICRDDKTLSTWPELEYEAGWGGCKMSVDRDEKGQMINFEYCATLSDEQVVRCNNTGCQF